MALLTHEELKTLAARSEPPSLSLFMPTHRAGPEIQQDPIRLKNLLKQAEAQLTDRMRAPEARAFLQPVHELLEDAAFWRHQSDGLAVFRAKDVFRVYRLPLAFTEFLSVSDRFYLKPLMPVLSQEGRFFVMALSQQAVRLLECSAHSVHQRDLPNAPQGVTAAEGYEQPETQLQLQPITPPGQPGSGIVHGHGSSTDVDDRNIERYLRQVNKAVADALRDERAPLIVAAVEYLHPLYRAVNSYEHLLDRGVTGNPDGLKPEELHQQALSVVKPYFQEARNKAAADYREGLAKGRASHAIDEIVRAAHQGRVASLFIALGASCWGRFDPQTYAVEVHEQEQAGDDELFDLAAVQTLLHAGAVYAVPPDQVPDGHAAAAVFRY
ncbi:baeRF3 domain-containing protein [Candidatus Nitrospira bockiana]